MKETATAAWTGLKETGSAAWTFVKNLSGRVGDGLKSLGGGIVRMAQSIWERMLSGMKSFWEGLKNMIKALPGLILDALKNLRSFIFSLFSAIAEGSLLVQLIKALWREIDNRLLHEKDPRYCTPYPNQMQAYFMWNVAMCTILPALRVKYGAESGDLWYDYLTRRPGDSLNYKLYTSSSSSVVTGFVNSKDTEEQQTKLVTWIAKGPLRKKIDELPANKWVKTPVGDLLDDKKLKDPFSFDDVYEIPGLLAGGASSDGSPSSDAGPDTREVSGEVELYREVDGLGHTKGARMRTAFDFDVKDAVDFCPGNPGSRFAQLLTVTLSRLEASGLAYDVPFEVKYKGKPREESIPFNQVAKVDPSGGPQGKKNAKN